MCNQSQNYYLPYLAFAIVKQTKEPPLISLLTKAKLASSPIHFPVARFNLFLPVCTGAKHNGDKWNGSSAEPKDHG